MTHDDQIWMEKATPEEIEWVEALESGEYAKGKERLGIRVDDGVRYCCLGVRLELDVAKGLVERATWGATDGFGRQELAYHDRYGGVENTMPGNLTLSRWGMDNGLATKLAGINDHNDTFVSVIAEIKEWISER
jgi:hypothetical protein